MKEKSLSKSKENERSQSSPHLANRVIIIVIYRLFRKENLSQGKKSLNLKTTLTVYLQDIVISLYQSLWRHSLAINSTIWRVLLPLYLTFWIEDNLERYRSPICSSKFTQVSPWNSMTSLKFGWVSTKRCSTPRRNW